MATGEGVNIKCGQCGSNINLMPDWYKSKRVWTIECPKCRTHNELTKDVSDRLIAIYKDKIKREKDKAKREKTEMKLKFMKEMRITEEREALLAENRRLEAMAKDSDTTSSQETVMIGGNTRSAKAKGNITQCSVCEGQVAKEAKTCPHCGAKGPAKKKEELAAGYGCLMLLAIALVVFFVFALSDNSGTKREQPQTDTWEADERLQPERREAIQELIDQGAFSKVEYRDRGAIIWVTPVFYILDFQDKEVICGIVYMDLATRARTDNVYIELRDSQSGNKVGQYTALGFKMN